jgi:hypothetical protein
MSKTNMAPAQINLFTSWISYIVKMEKRVVKMIYFYFLKITIEEKA